MLSLNEVVYASACELCLWFFQRKMNSELNEQLLRLLTSAEFDMLKRRLVNDQPLRRVNDQPVSQEEPSLQVHTPEQRVNEQPQKSSSTTSTSSRFEAKEVAELAKGEAVAAERAKLRCLSN